MEKCINEHGMNQIRQLNCCHSEYYSIAQTFKFLPGHAVILLALPKYARKFVEEFVTDHKDKPIVNDNYPFILNEMIKTAESNMYI